MSAVDVKANQNLVKKEAAVSFSSWFIFLVLGFYLFPKFDEYIDGITKLEIALLWNCLPLLNLAAGIYVLSVHRYLTTASNPLDGEESRAFKINVRYTQNTLEQVVLFCPSTIALSLIMNPEYLHIIPVLCILFFIGRFIFWLCYLKDPMLRSYGLSWSFAPSLLLPLYLAFRLVESFFI